MKAFQADYCGEWSLIGSFKRFYVRIKRPQGLSFRLERGREREKYLDREVIERSCFFILLATIKVC